MISLYTREDSPRLRYIVNELFTSTRGIAIEITTNVEEFYSLPEEFPKICYADEHIGNSLHIRPHGLLFEKGIIRQEVDVEHDTNGYHIFRTGKESDSSIAFDTLAASFYLLSRYEEYLRFTPDQHGRFNAEDSLAYKHGFLEEPVVDQWVQQILLKLNNQFNFKHEIKLKFKHIKTIDVDNVFAYRHKGILVNGAHIIVDLLNGRSNLAKKRLKIILRLENDPFFNLQELSEVLLPYANSTHFFFHCGVYGKRDKKVWFPSIGYIRIKRKIAKQGFNVGLHPSYRAAHRQWLFHIEKKVLEFCIGKSVTDCRAHYLLFKFPFDYRILERENITDDYTMGYSNNPGFRAGTSLPFHFYDLSQERATNLRIHPLIVMDKTLHSNMKLDPTSAKDYILKLAEKVKAVNGEFITLFHNENQTDFEDFGWKGWNQMYKDLLKEL